jgi:hypothetical protein
MVIRLRTWNINFWLNPRRDRTARAMKEKEKSTDEKIILFRYFYNILFQFSIFDSNKQTLFRYSRNIMCNSQ